MMRMRITIFVCVIALCSSVYLYLKVQHTNISSPSSLESAIMPPISFRRWFVGQGRNIYKDQGRNSVPSDRFAGRGLSNNPTVMPGYHEIGQRLAKAQYLPKITAIKQDLKAIDNDLNDSSKSEKWPDLKKRKEEDIAKLKKIYSDWFSTDVQRKVQSMNKDLVIGRARNWNKDKFLGGSDHFVTLNQAEKQLDGEGYGHRYSITDWLSGD